MVLLKTNINRIVRFMKTKNRDTFGFIKYSHFKKLICHVTNNNDSYEVRKIFLQLIEDNHIIKKKNFNINSYVYKFNFNTKKLMTFDNDPITIWFD